MLHALKLHFILFFPKDLKFIVLLFLKLSFFTMDVYHLNIAAVSTERNL